VDEIAEPADVILRWLLILVVAALSMGLGYVFGWWLFWIALIVLSVIGALMLA
jgi:hypothetical protein